MTNILNYKESNWTLLNATMSNGVFTILPGGTASFKLTELILSAVPDSLAFMATCDATIDESNPLVFGVFSVMYALPVDSITQELESDNGLTVLLPIVDSEDLYSTQEQRKYTYGTFTIYNKSDKEVTLIKPKLLRSEIKYINYIDENGLYVSGKTTYTLEIGHTLGDGAFYFNRSYVDKPYYSAPNNPDAVIEPITNAANKYIGGRVTNTNGKTIFVVCYCVIPGD